VVKLESPESQEIVVLPYGSTGLAESEGVGIEPTTEM
jgi:hypothetical protein